MAFATGKYSIGDCDRCGRTVKRRDLNAQVVNSKKSGFLVCDSCLDQDSPRWLLGKVRIKDPQAIRDPRPDNSNMGSMSPADRQALQDFIDSYTSGTP